MPSWLQYIVWAAAGVIAVGAIWTKLLRPLARLITYVQQILPLLHELTAQFKDSPNSFSVLEEIAQQFKTDSGSTLRDTVNRLENAANNAHIAAEALKVKAEILEVGVAAVKELSIIDRKEAAHRLVVLDSLVARFDALQVSLQALQGITGGNSASASGANSAPTVTNTSTTSTTRTETAT